ncbi:hypothetical protein AB0C96_22140 [Streptomyces sp. NPDC048506]|uniref:hypothetical protein n=1 Tax=Streptomyces sp. NPDC048506 TaxID=3155028 RepID=UPI00344AA1D8
MYPRGAKAAAAAVTAGTVAFMALHALSATPLAADRPDAVARLTPSAATTRITAGTIYIPTFRRAG